MATILNPDDKNATNVPQVGAPTMGAPASSALPQKQKSGQFTNIQSYLNANKGAGQQLAQGVGNQVQKKIDPAKTKTESYNDSVRQGIQGAQNTLAQGNTQVGQLQNIGSNIQANTGGQFYGQNTDLGIDAFKNDPNFNQFQKIQQGQGVNEDALAIQQRAFQNQANQYNQVAQDQANQASTEGGRFNLLKQSFGGNVNPKYSSGQQRLDQLFLQKQGIGDLKQNLQQNVDASRGFQAQTQETGQGVRSAQEGERSLLNNIDTQAKSNEDAYLKMLESYVPEVNNRRDKEYSDLAARYGAMGSVQSGGLLDKNGNSVLQKATPGLAPAQNRLSADDLKLLGLTKNSQTFDVFDNTKLDDVAEKGRAAQNFQDVANTNNVNQFASLADIARTAQGQRRLTQAGDLGAATLARTGAANLQNRLDEVGNSFNDYAKKQNYTEHAKAGSSWSESQANLSDILAGNNIIQADKRQAGNLLNQSNSIYKRALNDLRNKNYGNVLQTDGTVANALSDLQPSNNYVLTDAQKRQQAGSNNGMTNSAAVQLLNSQKNINYSNSNLDENLKAALAKLGVK